MTRRAVLGLTSLMLAYGDERTDLLDVVTPLANALSSGDADGFLRRITADAPNRAQLEDNIRGLIAQAEMTCSIQVNSIEADHAELDWYMEIRSRATQSLLERRKAPITVKVQDRRISLLKPVDFFKPVTVR